MISTEHHATAPEKNDDDIFVESCSDAVLLWQWDVDSEKHDLIQVTSHADALRLIDVLKDVAQQVFTPHPTEKA